jgi:hypothetical protein
MIRLFVHIQINIVGKKGASTSSNAYEWVKYYVSYLTQLEYVLTLGNREGKTLFWKEKVQKKKQNLMKNNSFKIILKVY